MKERRRKPKTNSRAANGSGHRRNQNHDLWLHGIEGKLIDLDTLKTLLGKLMMNTKISGNSPTTVRFNESDFSTALNVIKDSLAPYSVSGDAVTIG